MSDPRKRAGATKTSNTRARILAAADGLFAKAAREGQLLSNVTAKQLAREAGISQSSLYNHFKGGVAAVAHALAQNPNSQTPHTLVDCVPWLR